MKFSFILSLFCGVSVFAGEGIKFITMLGEPDCIELKNPQIRVVLCPSSGGRVLEYSLNGKHALPLPEVKPGKKINPAGRLDIGPELTTPKRPVLWNGDWTGEISGNRRARLTSPPCPNTKVQLIRDYELDAKTTRFTCTQTIKNISDKAVEYCYWSRTFAIGEGIAYIPLTPPSRFPNSYVMYESGNVINMKPEDTNIRIRDNFIEILAAPKKPKLGFDSYAGWMAYHMRNDLIFFKQYDADSDWVYNEAAGLTASIWYPDHMNVVELEPIGPRQRITPGGKASFTETWYLKEASFPVDPDMVHLPALRIAAKKLFDN